MNWRIGSKVKCIADDFMPVDCVTARPSKGATYTVRGTTDKTTVPLAMNFLNAMFSSQSQRPPGLLLREVTNRACECIPGGPEWGFDETAFRPVIEDDSKSREIVEQLKKLPNTAKAPEKVR